MAVIFFSYSRNETVRKHAVDNLFKILSSRFDVFRDDQIKEGEYWDDRLDKEIKTCACGVVVWTEVSVGSQGVKDEAMALLDAGKLIPVKLGRAAPNYTFKRVQWRDFGDWSGEGEPPGFPDLVARLEEAIGGAANTASGIEDKSASILEMGVLNEPEFEGFPELVALPLRPPEESCASGMSVELAHGFQIGVRPVTVDEWNAAAIKCPHRLDTRPSRPGPVTKVTWEEANEYIDCLNEQVRKAAYSLPSEIEWEYAARMLSPARFQRLAFDGNVKTRPSWEWCADTWTDDPDKLPRDGRPLQGGGYPERGARGGYWTQNRADRNVSERTCFNKMIGDSAISFRVRRCL